MNNDVIYVPVPVSTLGLLDHDSVGGLLRLSSDIVCEPLEVISVD